MANKYEKFGSRNFHPSGIGDSGGNGEGDIMYYGSTTVVAGKIYVLTTQECEEEDTGEGCVQWVAADADNANSSNLIAVAMGSGAANSVGMLLRGMATIVSGVDVSTAGAPLYISTTAGSMTSTIPSSADDYVRILGYTLATNKLWFNPDNSYIKIGS
jgi:hypothetical protein